MRLLVNTGGTDPTGVIFKLFPFLIHLEIEIIIMMGKGFKDEEHLYDLSREIKNIKLISFNHSILQTADIIICTFGVTLYESIYLGIPTICVAHNNENHKSLNNLFQKFPFFMSLGHINNIDIKIFNYCINQLLTDKKKYENISNKCFELIDGLGSKRVASILEGNL